MMLINPYRFAHPNTPPACISDGNTIAWYISDNLTTITKDGSNRVSKWSDYLGSGNDVEQSTDNYKPIWSSAGITFDGTDDRMVKSSVYLTRPEKYYLVVKQLTWTINDIFLHRGATGAQINQASASPKIGVYGSGNVALNDTAHLDTLEIIRYSIDSANPAPIKIRVNEYTETSGTAWISSGDGSIIIGCHNNLSANFINALFCEIIIRKIIDDAEDDAAIYNYLATKYSIT